ncbi:MAG: hypothetical protein FWF50_00170 [Defluviitaleaceae bacterium]|nr:hypothetical protein [Defluviitaleaceae bacterium]
MMNTVLPQINMILFETDIDLLQKFIISENLEGDVTEKYLILYNFAIDCLYSELIQTELINYLLPFYLKLLPQIGINSCEISIQIFNGFNSAMFMNEKVFKTAVGDFNYNYIMEKYVEDLINKMLKEQIRIIDWVSLFNTAISLDNKNIFLIFQKIFGGSIELKYAFFEYISVLLFKESDNLVVSNIQKEYWTSYIWFFNSEFSDDFFWNDFIVEYYNKEINELKIKNLFKEIKQTLNDKLGIDITNLISEEMENSFIVGIFNTRKSEFLQKISNITDKEKHWHNY